MLKWNNLGYLVLASIASALRLGCLIYSIEYTTVANGFLLSSLTPIFIIIWYFFRGRTVNRFEVIGSALALVGTIILTQDPTRSDYDISVRQITWSQKILQGDLVALMAAAAGAVFYLINQYLREVKYPLYFMNLFRNSLLVIVFMIYSLLFEEGAFYGVDNNIFGWLSHKWFLFMIILVLVTGPSNITIVKCVDWFDSLVVSCAILMFPVCAALISWMADLEPFPGQYTLVGGFVMIIGLYLVSSQEKKLKKGEQDDDKIKEQ